MSEMEGFGRAERTFCFLSAHHKVQKIRRNTAGRQFGVFDFCLGSQSVTEDRGGSGKTKRKDKISR